MKEDDVRSVFLLALYVLLGPRWNKRPDVTQEPEKGFIGALPLWSVPSGAPPARAPSPPPGPSPSRGRGRGRGALRGPPAQAGARVPRPTAPSDDALGRSVAALSRHGYSAVGVVQEPVPRRARARLAPSVAMPAFHFPARRRPSISIT